MTKLLQVGRLVVIFIKNLEFQEIFPVKFLQEPPQEGLPVVLSHLDTDFLPGLVSRAGPEASLLPHSLVQLEQVQWLLERKNISSTELISDSPDLVHGGTEREGLPFPSHEVHVGNYPAQSVRVGVQLKQDLQVKPTGLLELLQRFIRRESTL